MVKPAPDTQMTALVPFALAERAGLTAGVINITDSDGNLICVITSLGSPFGSGGGVLGTGITLNNFLYWADVQADSSNRSKPGGRPSDLHVADHLDPQRSAGAHARHARLFDGPVV